MGVTAQEAAAWAATHLNEPGHIDCTTTVMLKILDGKCKMREADKRAVGAMYEVVWQRPGHLLGDAVHALIARARADGGLVEEVYEQRLYAETMIGRPTMKAYKAMLREAGMIGGGGD